jgi:DNA-binding SARP family transcriptional activator
MLNITLFGPTVGVIDGRTVTASDLGGVKPRQILEILALDLGTSVTKDHLAELLWEGRPPVSYIGTLESYVCVLRRRLGAGPEDQRAFLRTSPHGYLLDPDHVRVDLAHHREVASAALAADGGPAVDLTESALALAAGELLASEPFAAYAIQARQRFRSETVELCIRAAQLAEATGDNARALTLSKRAFAWDRLSEDAGQQLMRALWSTGRRSQALRVFATLRQAILDEVGDEPGRESHDLYLAILRDEEAARRGTMVDAAAEVKVLLRLLRQAVELTPGLRVPPSDARLFEVAAAHLRVS